MHSVVDTNWTCQIETFNKHHKDFFMKLLEKISLIKLDNLHCHKWTKGLCFNLVLSLAVRDKYNSADMRKFCRHTPIFESAMACDGNHAFSQSPNRLIFYCFTSRVS